MVRAPCCDKVGLKKGPWTPEEDRILTDYIHSYGHANWRALPKQAGLLRCGKSCRLRWLNYLKPDIKRGSFSNEEEEAIINLHQMLGNRWSVIAASLPGRTDNEIKNMWHTHIKKRVINQADLASSKAEFKTVAVKLNQTSSASPLQSCSETSASATSVVTVGSDGNDTGSSKHIDSSFWWEALLMDVTSTIGDYMMMDDTPAAIYHGGALSSTQNDDSNFWLSVLNDVGGLKELAEI